MLGLRREAHVCKMLVFYLGTGINTIISSNITDHFDLSMKFTFTPFVHEYNWSEAREAPLYFVNFVRKLS